MLPARNTPRGLTFTDANQPEEWIFPSEGAFRLARAPIPVRSQAFTREWQHDRQLLTSVCRDMWGTAVFDSLS